VAARPAAAAPIDWPAPLVIHDITDRRHAEAGLRFQKSLLVAQGEASPHGILAVSPEGRILSFNRRFAELWQLPETVLATRSDEAMLGAVMDQRGRGFEPRSPL
jgi:PAS domain-containing protein